MLRSPTMRDETDEVRRALDGLNAAWRERRFADLETCFDAAAVMRGPGLIELVRGRKALVKSYADFMTKSEITDTPSLATRSIGGGIRRSRVTTGRWRGSRTARPIARQVRSCSCFNGGALSWSRSNGSCSIDRHRDGAIGRATWTSDSHPGAGLHPDIPARKERAIWHPERFIANFGNGSLVCISHGLPTMIASAQPYVPTLQGAR